MIGLTKIKLIGIDLDDTLAGASGRVSKRNLDALSRAENNGVYIVPATGRGLLGARRITDQLPLNAPVICFGGSMIVDRTMNDTLFCDYIAEESVKEVLRTAYSLGLHAQLYRGGDVVFKEHNEFTKRYTKGQGLSWRLEPQLPCGDLSCVNRVLVYSKPEHWEHMTERIRALLPDGLELSVSKTGFIEIGSAGCNKGAALERVAKHLGVPRENCAAIGDNALDESMIAWAGLGCCVENGADRTKSIAQLVIPACDDDGVACFIEDYVLKA